MKHIFGIIMSVVSLLQAQTSCIEFSPISKMTQFILVVDVSGSMSGKPMQDAKLGLKAFINQMETGDAAALVSFNTSTTLSQAMTTNKNSLIRAIDALKSEGGTHIYDAVAKAIELSNSHSDKSAIVLFTDGKDGGSQFTANHLQSMLGYEGCALYVIGLGDVDKHALRVLVKKASGELEITSSSTTLRQLYEKTMDLYKKKYLEGTQKYAQLEIRSMPGNRAVLIDGVDVGMTPLRVPKLSASNHDIQVFFNAGPWKCNSNLKEGMLGKIWAVESEVAKNIAIISVPHGSAIFLDNDFQGYTSGFGVGKTKESIGKLFKRTKSSPDYSHELILRNVPSGKHTLTLVPFANSEIAMSFNQMNYGFTMGKDNLIIVLDARTGEAELRTTSDGLEPSTDRFKLEQSTIFDDF